MKNIFTIFTCLLAFFLSGCWDQHDFIEISKNGDVKFKSKIYITDNSLGYSDVEEFSNEFMSEFKDRGWKLEKTWIKKEKPFELEFYGSGNLKEIKIYKDFYEFNFINEDHIDIAFRVSSNHRKISFKNSILESNAIVYSTNGNKVSNIENVDPTKIYIISLPGPLDLPDGYHFKRFTDNNDGTITDKNTGLMWASSDNGGNINWMNATEYCRHFIGGGFNDWRLPTQKELLSLFDPSAIAVYGYHITGGIKLSGTSWSSESFSKHEAHLVSFSTGTLFVL